MIMDIANQIVFWVFLSSLAVIFYTFAGYPIVLALWARLRPRPVREMAAFTPSVSLIIAAYNEADCIAAKLANCQELDYPQHNLELIVVADGSDDGTAEVARRHPAARVLFDPERRGKMAAINRAVAEARGEILVFSDANNMYTPKTLRALLRPLADPTVGVVTGRKAIDDGRGRPLDRAEGLYWRYESKIKEWESRIGSVTGVAGEILAMRRNLFQPPPTGTVNDDFVLAMMAAAKGWRVAYAADAVSLEPASATLDDETTRRSRIVAGRYQALRMLFPELLRHAPQVAWQVLSHKGLRPVIPFAMLLAAVSNLWLLPFTLWGGWTLAAQWLFYSAAVMGWLNERGGRRNRWLYLPYYFCRVNLAATRGLNRFLTHGNNALWTRVARG